MNFYGDNIRWFIGTVVDLGDPTTMGRIKVRVIGVHGDSIKDEDLPWAQTVVPINEGGTKELGNALGIQVDARVFGIFMDGKDSQMPLILGSMPKYEDDTSGDRSTPRLSRGINTISKTPDTVNGEPESPYAAVYPNNKVTQTPSGHVIEIDDTPSAERIHIYHKSGSFVEFHPNGDVVTQHKNGFKLTAGDEKIHITGKLEITVDDDITIKSTKGNILIETEDTSKKIDLNP